jgi:hypothetical protein
MKLNYNRDIYDSPIEAIADGFGYLLYDDLVSDVKSCCENAQDFETFKQQYLEGFKMFLDNCEYNPDMYE